MGRCRRDPSGDASDELAERLDRALGGDVAGDHEHGVARRVVRVDELARLLERDGADARRVTADGLAVRMARRVRGALYGHPRRVDFGVAADLVDDDLALAIERRLVDRRAAESEPHGLDREQRIESSERAARDVRRRVPGRDRVEVRRDVLERREQRLAAEHLLEHQVFDEVSHARTIEIVYRADLIAHRDLDLRRMRILDEHDAQAVRQRETRDPDPQLGVAGRRGRRIRPERACAGHHRHRHRAPRGQQRTRRLHAPNIVGGAVTINGR